MSDKAANCRHLELSPATFERGRAPRPLHNSTWSRMPWRTAAGPGHRRCLLRHAGRESGLRLSATWSRHRQIALRAHLAELGIVAAKGDKGVKELLTIVADERDTRLPIDARASVVVLAAQLQAVQTLIGSIEKRIKTQHRSSQASKRLETIPGIGVIGATAIAATVADPTVFRSERDFAAWIGLVP
jgi:transposase